MITIAQTFSGTARWYQPGGYFKLLSTVNPVDVVLIDKDGEPHEALQVEAGFYTRLDFEKIEITTAASEAVKFVIADNESGNDSILQNTARSVKFSASGSYVVPAGVTMLKVTGIGPGGGGGGGHTAATCGGGGGGGSSMPMTQQIVVVPGETLAITIPAGGVGGAAGANATAVTDNCKIQRTVNGAASGSAIFVVPSGAGGSKGTATNGGAGGPVGTTGTLVAGGATGTGAGANGTGQAAIDTKLWIAHGGGGGGAGGGPSSAGGNGGTPWGALYLVTFGAGMGGGTDGSNGGGGGGGVSPFSRAGRGGEATAAGESAFGYGSGGGGGGCTAAGGNGGDAFMIIETA